jgi:hypothetical protein
MDEYVELDVLVLFYSESRKSLLSLRGLGTTYRTTRFT